MFCVYTEVMAQDDICQFLPMSKPRPVLITHSWGATFTETKKSYNTSHD